MMAIRSSETSLTTSTASKSIRPQSNNIYVSLLTLIRESSDVLCIH
jgi:hypothetical protein